MIYKIPRIMLAAPASKSGKTTITCGILQAFLSRGCALSAFKCGPDYIDPMFHNAVLGVKGGNLDSFFLEDQQVRRQLVRGGKVSDLAVIEGVMGYYDGVGGVSSRASSYDIARITDTPVILIVDCRGSSLSLAALIQGFIQYQSKEKPFSCIKGVLLNRIRGNMAERLRPEIEKLGIPVVGWIPECPEMKLESRHLGLVMPKEMKQLTRQMKLLSEQIEQTVDLELIQKIAGAAPEIELPDVREDYPVVPVKEPLRIAIAKDRAFNFYYQENLQMLEAMGARLIPFRPTEDQELPKEIDGIVLGGGYPELYAAELSSNRSMRCSIKSMMETGIPCLAECGGFLYLHRQLEAKDGTVHPMVGIIEGSGYRTDRLSRFGYLSLIAKREDACLTAPIKGHEFHYWDSTDCGTDWEASKPAGGRSYECMHSRGYQIFGFAHLYYPSNPEFIRLWLEGCRSYGEGRGRS